MYFIVHAAFVRIKHDDDDDDDDDDDSYSQAYSDCVVPLCDIASGFEICV